MGSKTLAEARKSGKKKKRGKKPIAWPFREVTLEVPVSNEAWRPPASPPAAGSQNVERGAADYGDVISAFAIPCCSIWEFNIAPGQEGPFVLYITYAGDGPSRLSNVSLEILATGERVPIGGDVGARITGGLTAQHAQEEWV